MNRIFLTLCFSILLASLYLPNNVQAQTSSRIKGSPSKAPETVVWFTEPTEITEIRLLLQAGKKQEAVARARDFLDRLKGVSGVEAEVRRYYGFSALCSALTTTGELREAIESCSKAIKLYPTRWQALNNRGVAYYMSGQFDRAMQDYNKALAAVQGSDPLTELIQHNIDLVNTKKSGTSQ